MTELLDDWKQRGRSILLASHVLHEVEAIKPSFLLISGGRLLASGSPAEVRNLLIDLPSEIELRVDDSRRAAALFAERLEFESIRIASQEQLCVVTRRAQQFFEALPGLALEHGLNIMEVRTGDESLQDLFTTLMRRHRGEI